MKRSWIAAVICAAALCVATGCGTQGGNTAEEPSQESAAFATTSAAVAATEAAALPEEEMNLWQEEDDAYLTGITASDFVELSENYRKLVVEAAKPVDPTDDEVDARIQAELINRATVEESGHAHVRKGDIVNIDYVGKIDGEEFEGGSGSYDLEIGSGSFIDGFEDGLIGVKKGKTVDLNLTFPENYYPEKGLAGKPVVFTVTVNKISEKVVPELTDEFARSLNLTNAFGQAVTTVGDYREYIRSNMIEDLEADYEKTVKTQIVAALVQDSTYKQEPPVHMVDKYEYLLTRQLTYRALQSYTDLETLMIQYYGATKENYLDLIRGMAESYAKQGIAFQAIADREKLNPDADAVSAYIAEYVATDSTVEKPEELDRVIRESLRDELMSDSVIDWLYHRCKVEEPKAAEDASTALTASEVAATEQPAAAATEETAAAAGESSAAAETAGTAEAAAETAGTEEAAAEESENAADNTGEKAQEAEKEKAAQESAQSGIVLEGDDDTAARHEN